MKVKEKGSENKRFRLRVTPTQGVLSPEGELDRLSFILFCTEDKRERSYIREKIKALRKDLSC